MSDSKFRIILSVISIIN